MATEVCERVGSQLAESPAGDRTSSILLLHALPHQTPRWRAAMQPLKSCCWAAAHPHSYYLAFPRFLVQSSFSSFTGPALPRTPLLPRPLPSLLLYVLPRFMPWFSHPLAH